MNTQRHNLVVESSCDSSHLRVQELWVWVVTSLTIVRMIPHHAWQSLSRRRQWPYTWASFFIIKIYKKIKIKIKWDLREKTQHGYQGLRLFWPSVPYQIIGPVPPQPNWLKKRGYFSLQFTWNSEVHYKGFLISLSLSLSFICFCFSYSEGGLQFQSMASIKEEEEDDEASTPSS